MPVLRFRLFGFPIQVLPGYWLFTALLCFGGQQISAAVGLATMLVIFLSILSHELGHAFAARYFGISAVITLHTMGGLTAFPPRTQLTRLRDIAISLAGPAAGFLLGGLGWGALLVLKTAPSEQALNAISVLQGLVWINLFWSAVNLFPVIPFDGGRVMAAALGPRRRVLAMSLSLAAAILASIGLGYAGYPLGAVLFASSAISSAVQAYRENQRRPTLTLEQVPDTLDLAKKALDHGLWDRAESLSALVLGAHPPAAAEKSAWETLFWSRLGRGDAEAALAALALVPEGLDPYLVAAIQNEAGETATARLTLEAARTAGDTRIEVMALLIRVLLTLSDAEAAAQLTREALAGLAPPDVRRVIQECQTLKADAAAAKLSLDLAENSLAFEDAAKALELYTQLSDAEGRQAALNIARRIDLPRSRDLESPALSEATS